MPTAQRPAPTRTYSRYGREAVIVLGQLIRINRIERKLSVVQLAERVGASRDLMLYRGTVLRQVAAPVMLPI